MPRWKLVSESGREIYIYANDTTEAWERAARIGFESGRDHIAGYWDEARCLVVGSDLGSVTEVSK